MNVKSFRGVNYLSIRPDLEIIKVDDIGETAQIEDEDLEDRGIVRKIVEGEINSAVYSEVYDVCISCNVKVKSEDQLITECLKYNMMMKCSRCKKLMTARVCVTGEDGKMHTLTMFDNIIQKIISDHNTQDIKRALLDAPEHRFNLDKGDVVYSIVSSELPLLFSHI